MTVKINPSSAITGREPTKAELAIIEGLPALIDNGFSKLVTLLFVKGVLKVNEQEDSLPLESVIAAVYAAAISIGTGRGMLDFDKGKSRVDAALTNLMKTATFDVDGKASIGCGKPDCDACNAANEEADKGKAEVKPSATTVH